MVGGQTLDMQSEDKAIDISTLESIHRTKQVHYLLLQL